MPWTSDVRRHVLSNGLTLLVQRHAAAPVVAVVTHVRAGYFDEPDEWVGISHVLEHMFFKGTPRFGPGALARETQRLGGYVNAGTIYDKTIYYAVGPSTGGGLAHFAGLQADALRNLSLDPDELARELEVIVQEAKRKLDTPGAVTGESLYAQLFRRHRMGRWRIGVPEQLRRLTAADLRAYYRSRYAPERVIVSLVGDLDPDETVALGEQLWGDWSVPYAPVEPSPEEPPGTPGTLKVLRGDIARPLAAIGWRTVGALDPDTPALDVAGEVLSAGRTAWLARAVRDHGLAASVAAGHYTPAEVGVFELSLTADRDTLRQALDSSMAAVTALVETGPSDADMDRVRALQRTRWARRLEASEGRATAFAEFEALGGYDELDLYLDRIATVDAATVRRAAATWISDGPAGVIYLPRGAEWDENRWPPTPGGPPVRDPAPSTAADVPHPARSATRAESSQVSRRAVPAGDVLARRQAASGLVSLALLARGLREEETRETAGMTRLLVRSALRADHGRWSVAAEQLGGSLGAVSTMDTAGWTLTVPPEHAQVAAGLLARLAREATFDADGIAIEARLQADLASARRDDMYRYPLQRLLAVTFGDDPYGLAPLGEPERLPDFSVEDLRRWHERWHASPVLAVVAGDGEVEGLLDGLEGAVGGWPSRHSADGPGEPRWHAERVEEPRERQQSALAMAFPAVPAVHASRHALTVIGAVLSGLAGRLFEELRERRSLAYTVQGSPWLRRRGGAFLTYIATSPERVGEARDAMLAELARLARDPVPDDELERARQYAAGLHVLRTVHTAAVRDAIVDGWCTGTLADLDAGPDRLRAVTPDEVREGAATVFGSGRRAEFLLTGRPRD